MRELFCFVSDKSCVYPYKLNPIFYTPSSNNESKKWVIYSIVWKAFMYVLHVLCVTHIFKNTFLPRFSNFVHPFTTMNQTLFRPTCQAKKDFETHLRSTSKTHTYNTYSKLYSSTLYTCANIKQIFEYITWYIMYVLLIYIYNVYNIF